MFARRPNFLQQTRARYRYGRTYKSPRVCVCDGGEGREYRILRTYTFCPAAAAAANSRRYNTQQKHILCFLQVYNLTSVAGASVLYSRARYLKLERGEAVKGPLSERTRRNLLLLLRPRRVLCCAMMRSQFIAAAAAAAEQVDAVETSAVNSIVATPSTHSKLFVGSLASLTPLKRPINSKRLSLAPHVSYRTWWTFSLQTPPKLLKYTGYYTILYYTPDRQIGCIENKAQGNLCKILLVGALY